MYISKYNSIKMFRSKLSTFTVALLPFIETLILGLLIMGLLICSRVLLRQASSRRDPLWSCGDFLPDCDSFDVDIRLKNGFIYTPAEYYQTNNPRW